MPRSNSPTKKVVTTVSSVPSTPVTVPSFTQIIKEGFAFGAGSSIARNVIDRIMSPSQTLPPSRVCHEPCIIEKRAYDNCVLAHDSEVFCGDAQRSLENCMDNNKK